MALAPWPGFTARECLKRDRAPWEKGGDLVDSALRTAIKLRADQAALGWQAVCTMLEDRHKALRAFITEHDNDALYGGRMKGGRNAWTTGRWAEAAGPSHYRSAARYIRARLRAMG
mgnify:CR=1 FL=1